MFWMGWDGEKVGIAILTAGRPLAGSSYHSPDLVSIIMPAARWELGGKFSTGEDEHLVVGQRVVLAVGVSVGHLSGAARAGGSRQLLPTEYLLLATSP